MTNSRAKARIEARIKERAAYCVEFELNDPRATFITITRVEVSSDLSTAHIFYSVYGTEADKTKTAHMLASAAGFVQRQIGRVLKTRRIPRVAWVYDDSIERAADMDRKIHAALEHDREINPAAHVELTPAPAPAPQDEVEAEYLDFLQAQEDEEEAPD